MTEIGTPEPGTAVIFTLDLPRRVRPFKCSAVLLRLDTEGRANPVWSGSVAERRSGAAGGALTVRPDSSVLIPADYLMELKSPTGNVIENYLFGVRVR